MSIATPLPTFTTIPFFDPTDLLEKVPNPFQTITIATSTTGFQPDNKQPFSFNNTSVVVNPGVNTNGIIGYQHLIRRPCPKQLIPLDDKMNQLRRVMIDEDPKHQAIVKEILKDIGSSAACYEDLYKFLVEAVDKPHTVKNTQQQIDQALGKMMFAEVDPHVELIVPSLSVHPRKFLTVKLSDVDYGKFKETARSVVCVIDPRKVNATKYNEELLLVFAQFLVVPDTRNGYGQWKVIDGKEALSQPDKMIFKFDNVASTGKSTYAGQTSTTTYAGSTPDLYAGFDDEDFIGESGWRRERDEQRQRNEAEFNRKMQNHQTGADTLKGLLNDAQGLLID